MSKTHAWELLTDNLRVRYGAEERRLLSGNVKSQEDYRALIGWLEGVRYVWEAPDRLQKELDLARSMVAEDKAAAE